MHTEYRLINPDNVDTNISHQAYPTEVVSIEVVSGILVITLKILPVAE